MKPNLKNVTYMLKESNAIERVYDDQSLDDALYAWNYLVQEIKLTPNVIRETHRILMQNQDIEDKYKGDWRDVPVYIGGERKSQPKIVIDSLMRDFCSHVNELLEMNARNHDFVGHCHLKFEGVHPFVDGNGRMGRIILNWQLLKLKMPLTVYTEADKVTYYRIFPSYRRMELERAMRFGDNI